MSILLMQKNIVLFFDLTDTIHSLFPGATNALLSAAATKCWSALGVRVLSRGILLSVL